MHVAVAVFTAIWIEHLLKMVRVPTSLRVVNFVWVLAISWSTVAIRQHVVLDAVAGASLGASFAMLSLHWRPDASPVGVAKGDRIVRG
jgi:membrane-associated phospholipid phosphatase